MMNPVVPIPANSPAPASLQSGGFPALAARLGAPVTPERQPEDVRDLVLDTPARLRAFLESYRTEVLVPGEWPAIVEAHRLAAAGWSRELIAFDHAWRPGRGGNAFARASLAVGRRQLGRLRPIRDHAVIRRYAAAVDAGEAQGWHPMVYGLMLAVFGLPLRPGLLHYAHQTLGGFAAGARLGVSLSEQECAAILEAECEALVPDLTRLLLPSADSAPWPRVVS